MGSVGEWWGAAALNEDIGGRGSSAPPPVDSATGAPAMPGTDKITVDTSTDLENL